MSISAGETHNFPCTILLIYGHFFAEHVYSLPSQAPHSLKRRPPARRLEEGLVPTMMRNHRVVDPDLAAFNHLMLALLADLGNFFAVGVLGGPLLIVGGGDSNTSMTSLTFSSAISMSSTLYDARTHCAHDDHQGQLNYGGNHCGTQCYPRFVCCYFESNRDYPPHVEGKIGPMFALGTRSKRASLPATRSWAR